GGESLLRNRRLLPGFFGGRRLPCQRGDQLPAEIGDVLDDAAPYDLAIAEGRLVAPGRARVEQVVLDAQAARRGAALLEEARRDQHQPGMADGPDDLAIVVDALDEVEDGLVAAQLVGRPAARHDNRVELGGANLPGGGVRLARQAMLALVAV